MQVDSRPSFAFLVVTYNHQDYILEHLESIKYLVQTFGAGIDVDVIINDDCSRDQTRLLVEKWLKINANLFRHVTTIFNPQNLGTCASLNNMLSHMEADRCKATAGDDVYSFENIFELTNHRKDVAMVSGRALHLVGNRLTFDRLSNGLTTATQVIYKKDTLLHRFKHFSYNNAPNLLYATECLMQSNVREYLGRFDVTEDWPLQVAIAREFPERRFEQINEILVYYRRTAGSTYIVANQRFVSDKIKIYDDLIHHEPSWFERMRLASRKVCFNSQSRWINKLLNLDFYLFSLSCAFHILEIVKHNNTLKMRVGQHQQHYAYIKAAATDVGKDLN